jgi:hypothetical protein
MTTRITIENAVLWPIATMAFQYGPPALLAILGLYLLARGSSSPVPPPVTDSPPRDIVASATAPRGTKLITLGQYLVFGGFFVMIIGLILMIIAGSLKIE